MLKAQGLNIIVLLSEHFLYTISIVLLKHSCETFLDKLL